MSHYRDDLDAARARIATLEAKLKEREAALDARDAELMEIRAEITRMRRGEGGGFLADGGEERAGSHRALLVAVAACSLVTAVGFAMAQPRHCHRRYANPPVSFPVELAELPPTPVGALQGRTELRLDAAVGEADDAVARFDRGAADKALRGAERHVDACRRAYGPTGAGQVKVVFRPDGEVGSSEVEGAPYAGTRVGRCVAQRFRSATVPPFDGSPVTVHHTFHID